MNQPLKNAVLDFAAKKVWQNEIVKNYHIPAADTPLPDADEVELSRFIETSISSSTSDSLVVLNDQSDFVRAYAMYIFAIRHFVLAVRDQESLALKVGLTALVLDDALVDWRDILRALSIAEDASKRLVSSNFKFDTFLEQLAERASSRRRSTLVSGYLSREPAMRAIAVMRYSAVGIGSSFTYVSV